MRYNADMSNTVPVGVIDFVSDVNDVIINPILAFIFTAALVYFLWGLVLFLYNMGEQAKIEDGKRHMMYGLIGMTIMVSVYAIIGIGLRTFGVVDSDLPAPLSGANG